MKFIKSSIEENIGTIIFNKDTKRNSLNIEMLGEIHQALDDFKKRKLE